MAATVSEQYTYDVNVQESGAAESGVLIYGWNTAETVIVNKTTDAQGDVTTTNVEAASHSVTGFATTTTGRNPFKVRALKYGFLSFEVTLNINAATVNTYFISSDPVITQATKATVDAYTGYTISTAGESITLDGTGGTPVNDFDRLYDRASSSRVTAATPPQFDFEFFINSTDGLNYTAFYDLIISGFTFDADGRGLALDGTKTLDITGAGNISNGLTVASGDVNWQSSVTTLTNIDVLSGALDFNTATTYTIDGGTVDEVTNSSGGSVTLNLINGATVATNTGPNITINQAVTVLVNGLIEGTAVKVIADETVGTVTKGDTILETLADNNGEASTSLNYEPAFNPSGLDVLIRARNQGLATAAVAEDNGTGFTDETTNSNSSATNDMTLTPASPAVNDAYYFGHPTQFPRLKVNVSTAGSGLTLTWEYWNGASWASLSGVSDGTSNWSSTGTNIVSWTVPGDWSTQTVNSQGPYFYVRARVSAVSTPTQALGRQATLDVTRYLPVPPTGVLQRTITASGLTATLSQAVDSISTF